MLIKQDLFRTADRKHWINPRGFEPAAKQQSLSPSKGQYAQNDAFSAADFASENCKAMVEPFKEPNQQPDFVRTPRKFMDERDKLQTLKRIKEAELATNQIYFTQQKAKSVQKKAFEINANETKISQLSFLSSLKLEQSDLGDTQNLFFDSQK